MPGQVWRQWQQHVQEKCDVKMSARASVRVSTTGREMAMQRRMELVQGR